MANTTAGGALIFIERSHPAVIESVRRMVTGENEVGSAGVRDFDSNEYVVTVDSDGTAMIIGIRHVIPPAWFDAHCKGELKQLLQEKFAGAVTRPDPEDPTIAVAVRVPLPENDPLLILQDPLLVKAASLRTILLTAPFVKCVSLFSATPDPGEFSLRIPYRPDENMYLYTAKNNFCVVITMRVPDPSDRLIVRTFLSEFAETKRLDRAAIAGPGFSVLYGGNTPAFPAALKPVESASDAAVFWCMFSLSKKSMENTRNLEQCVEQLANFRNFVMYHMQCARSAMHAKMRDRVKSAQQVLARAKTSTTGRPRVSVQ